MKHILWRVLADKDCWVGAITGFAGAQMLAMNVSYSGWGFVLFLVSNIFMLAFGIIKRAKGLVLMQLGFAATSLQGIYNYLLPAYFPRWSEKGGSMFNLLDGAKTFGMGTLHMPSFLLVVALAVLLAVVGVIAARRKKRQTDDFYGDSYVLVLPPVLDKRLRSTRID